MYLVVSLFTGMTLKKTKSLSEAIHFCDYLTEAYVCQNKVIIYLNKNGERYDSPEAIARLDL